jgi:microcystin-dependent protein
MTQPFPSINSPLVLPNGMLSQAWLSFFRTLWDRSGGSTGGGSFEDLPTGSLVFWGGSTNPDGSLLYLCNGTAKSRVGDLELFQAIGTLWGPGDGSTTFNLPDFRGKALLGSGGAWAAGATGGNSTVTLTEGQLPAHTHPLTDPAHSHATSDPGHDHSSIVLGPQVDPGAGLRSAVAGTTGTNTTGFLVAPAVSNILIGDTGNGDPVSVMQPYAVVPVYIRR